MSSTSAYLPLPYLMLLCVDHVPRESRRVWLLLEPVSVVVKLELLLT